MNALSPGRLAWSERWSSISQPHFCAPRDTQLAPCSLWPLHGRLTTAHVVVCSYIQSVHIQTTKRGRPVGVWDNTPCTSPQNCATRHSRPTQSSSCARDRRRSSSRQAASHAAPSRTQRRATRCRRQPAHQWGEKAVTPQQGLQRRAGRGFSQADARGARGPDR